MKKFRSDRLGIEVEINTRTGEPNLFEINNLFEIKETKTCVKVSCEGKKVITVLPDSKIEIRDFITCYKGRIVVFGNAFVEAWGMSRVFAKDKTRVVAYQGSEIRAGGRTKVRALDSSRVIAGGRAEVYLDGKSIGYKRPGGRVRMRKFDNRAAIFDIN